jgi:hypothetical protein
MSNGFPRIRTDVDESTLPSAVDSSVSVVGQFTQSSPAVVHITCTNRASSPRTFQFGGSPPFSRVVGHHTQTEAKLYAIPDDRRHIRPDSAAESFESDAPVDGCWRATGHPVRQFVGLSRTLAPGESVDERYTLLAAPDNDPCLPFGEYVFTGETLLADNGGWQFSVVVEQLASDSTQGR